MQGYVEWNGVFLNRKEAGEVVSWQVCQRVNEHIKPIVLGCIGACNRADSMQPLCGDFFCGTGGIKECDALGVRVGAKEVGTLIAKRAAEKNIKSVVFDRSGYIYHGVVKEFAEAAREAGLEF